MGVAIGVHGGAGAARKDDDPTALEEGCRKAAAEGHRILLAGGSALDAAVAAVAAMEDDPQFNAGTGACLNRDGEVECDASVMDGAALRAGAVALVRTVKNPVALARAVMERTAHVFIAGAGAEALADEAGLARVSNEALITAAARARWEAARARAAAPSPEGGTVGAVALDARGHLAAATSTGGMILKAPGRIGDSPVLGAGTWADDLSGAASATGHGEAILRVGLTRAACDLLARGAPVHEAAQGALALLARVQGEAGLLLLTPEGGFCAAFNTQRMSRAWIAADGSQGSGYLPDR